MTYLKIFYDSIDALEQLGDAERGRLILAMMKYGSTGEVMQLNGNERVLFPIFKAQIDRDEKEMNTLSNARSEAGRKGAEKRWQTMANDGKAILPYGKNGNCYFAINEENKENEKETAKEKEIEKKDIKENNSLTRVKEKPTVEEIAAYCAERKNGINAQAFYDFYQSRGWRVGSSGMPIRDWRACVRTWEQRQKPKKETSFDIDEFFNLATRRND